jgi:hypothetical protein
MTRVVHHEQRQLEIYNKRDVNEFMTLFSEDCQLVDLQTVRARPEGVGASSAGIGGTFQLPQLALSRIARLNSRCCC